MLQNQNIYSNAANSTKIPQGELHIPGNAGWVSGASWAKPVLEVDKDLRQNPQALRMPSTLKTPLELLEINPN